MEVSATEHDIGQRPARAGALARYGLALLLAVASVAVATPAEAVEVERGEPVRLLDELTLERFQVVLPGGQRARGMALRLPAERGELDLRSHLARGTAAGLQTLPTMSREQLPHGAVAGINGGYWLSRPAGVPNGLYVQEGRLVAGDSSGLSGIPAGRAVAGFRLDNSMIADRLRVTLTLDLPWGGEVLVDEVNRQPRTPGDGTQPVNGELLLFDANYGPSFRVPAGSVLLVVEELALGSSGRVEGQVLERRDVVDESSWTVADGTSVLVAYGERVGDLIEVLEGAPVGVTVTVAPRNGDPAAWDDLRFAVPGGGLLIRDGRISSGTEMADEGLNHVSSRTARTAVAQLEDGSTLLVTIDRTGGSSGLTLHELGRALRAMGATNAVALDGGGSTSMTISGEYANRPAEPNRSHMNALFVYAPLPPPVRSLDEACPATVTPAGFQDTAASVHAASIDCLAWWGVTTGVTPASYVPAGNVTRGQMASFLARWLDGLADRGSGQALPANASLPFADVPAGDPHAPAIARLAAAGIVQGRSADVFDPVAPVSRAETATLVRRAVEHATGDPLAPGRDTFVDDGTSVHEESIDRLAGVGVIGGTGGYLFDPAANVSRAAMASLVMRASALLVEQGLAPPPA